MSGGNAATTQTSEPMTSHPKSHVSRVWGFLFFSERKELFEVVR